jgi:ribose transport system permease protein
MLGTAFGVLIQAVLQNGFIIIGLQQYWQYIAIGAAVIGAVYLDQVRRQSLLER